MEEQRKVVVRGETGREREKAGERDKLPYS